MTYDLKPYPQYRLAEGKWLGKIPSHWSVRRMKYIVRQTDSRSESGKEQLLRVSQYTGVTRRLRDEGSDEQDSRADSLAGYKLVEPNDLVVNIMLAWNGSMGVSRYSGIASPAYCVYRFRRDIRPWFFHNLLRSPIYKARIKASSTGIVESRLRLYSDDLGRIEGIVPPLSEQDAIVRFLDHATSQIERAIRAKKKLIALLNEQKQAIIHRAVTRGLDPNVPLKPSGIPWLGDIPANWQTRKLKFVVSATGGMTPSKSVESFWGGRIPWVSPKDMKVREIADSQDHITQAAIQKTSIAIIPPPSVLIVVRGMILARTFPAAVTSSPVTINQDMKALKPREDLDANYLVSLLIGIEKELLRIVEIAGHGTCCLRSDSWENFKLPIPSVGEQLQISAYLKNQLETINIAIGKAERETGLLSEYRSRLVADTVTGKLDVRGVAANLREEALPEADAIPDADELAETELTEEELIA